MEHKPNEREGCYEKENVVFCFFNIDNRYELLRDINPIY